MGKRSWRRCGQWRVGGRHCVGLRVVAVRVSQPGRRLRGVVASPRGYPRTEHVRGDRGTAVRLALLAQHLGGPGGGPAGDPAFPAAAAATGCVVAHLAPTRATGENEVRRKADMHDGTRCVEATARTSISKICVLSAVTFLAKSCAVATTWCSNVVIRMSFCIRSASSSWMRWPSASLLALDASASSDSRLHFSCMVSRHGVQGR